MAIRWDKIPHDQIRLKIHAGMAEQGVSRSAQDSSRHILRRNPNQPRAPHDSHLCPCVTPTRRGIGGAFYPRLALLSLEPGQLRLRFPIVEPMPHRSLRDSLRSTSGRRCSCASCWRAESGWTSITINYAREVLNSPVDA